MINWKVHILFQNYNDSIFHILYINISYAHAISPPPLHTPPQRIYKYSLTHFRFYPFYHHNAGNEFSHYTWMQDRLKHINPTAVFIPRASLSVNRVGQAAAVIIRTSHRRLYLSTFSCVNTPGKSNEVFAKKKKSIDWSPVVRTLVSEIWYRWALCRCIVELKMPLQILTWNRHLE